MGLARAERDVDEREALEHLVLDGLRPAAPDPDNPLRLFALEPLGLPQVRDEAGVGGLADRARVEQDQIGLGPLGRLAVAERLEHPLHPLGVVLVHLAAEGGEVVALHRSTKGNRESPNLIVRGCQIVPRWSRTISLYAASHRSGGGAIRSLSEVANVTLPRSSLERMLSSAAQRATRSM